MGVLKTSLLFALVCVVIADNSGVMPPGPTETSSTSTSSSTSSSSTSTTPKPITTSPTPTNTTTKPITTSTTSKPITTSSTSKPTSSTSSAPNTTTTSSTPKPTPPSTTPTPTTPAPVDPIGKWAVNYTNTNRTCLLLQAELSIDVNYKVGNATKNLTVHVPSTAKALGLCGPQNENITLAFSSIPNVVNFNFKKSNDSKRYDVQSVIIVLNVTVPGENASRIFVLTHAKDEFSTPVSSSYKCFKEQKLNLTAQGAEKDYEGVLRVSHLQVQAFRNATNTKFDEALDCASSETPDVVPIAVGCALAALVVIVLVAYIIGRRRSQARGYLSM